MAKRTALAAVLMVSLAIGGRAQSLGANDAYFVRAMLRAAYETVRDHYYDPTFHGLDWDARYHAFEQRLQSVTSVDAGQVLVAEFLDGLKDSHTFFQPPARSFDVDYGYRFALIGDRTFVTHTHAGTDAAAKLSPGDEVEEVNGLAVDRETFHTVRYILDVLAPRSSTALTVRDAAGAERTVTVQSAVHPRRVTRALTNGNELSDVNRQREADVAWMASRQIQRGDVTIWQLPVFSVESGEIDRLVGTARRHAALVLDLRGNSGGREDTLTRLAGNLLDHDIVLATRRTRNDRVPIRAQTRGPSAFGGRLVVLVDSASASAAEMLARVVQLERRGTVIGDRTAGAVMEARGHAFRLGNDALLYYALSVTEADVLMADQQSLEGVGVTPDEVVLPTPADLAAGRDPALARALTLAGFEIDAAAAGKLLPYVLR